MAALAFARIGTCLNRVRYERHACVKGPVSLVPPRVALHAEATGMTTRAVHVVLGNPGAVRGPPSRPVICRPDGSDVGVAFQTLERSFCLLRMFDMAEMAGFGSGSCNGLRDFLVDRLVSLHVREIIKVAVRASKAVLLQHLLVDLVGEDGPGFRGLLPFEPG